MTPEQLETARREILDMADRQEAFADPAIYPHLSDANRGAFHHAAKMLREAVARYLKPTG